MMGKANAQRCQWLLLVLLASPVMSAEPAKRPRRDPSGGIFFYAKEGYASNTAAIANPDVLGNWVQFYWSEVEQEHGQYDWSVIDSRMKPWVDAGKKVAFRVYWIGSGYWRNHAARTATPASVWADGAKFVTHADSGTEIPLTWDPIYKKRAFRFLQALAERYDDNPHVLFFDVTPGAETNPYRFVAFNQRTPEFKDQYASAAASDGRKYSDEIWQATVREWIDEMDAIFKQLPLLVTLNVGTLNLGVARKDYSIEIGQYAVARGFYVGQNGLHGASYTENSGRKAAFLKWSKQTRIVFETLGDAGTSTAYGKKPLGTLREIVDAANRVNAHYLLPYPMDVLKGTKGQPNYDPEFAAALAHGARTLGQGNRVTAEPMPAPPISSDPPKFVPALAGGESAPTSNVNSPEAIAQGFQLQGERWTYRDGEFVMSGILLKPEGQGPFPAVLISHGLGGSAESFGLNKARTMVKWGLVCIAPDYTHSAKFTDRRPGNGPGAGRRRPTQGATRPAAGGPRANPQYGTYGASEENIRRAKTCLELVSKMPEVDAKRIAAYGHSMGGFVTIGLASISPDVLKVAAITGSGVAPRDGFPAPSVAKAEKIRTPFLIMHGSADTVVRPEQSADLKAVLDKNRVPNNRTVFKGEGHPIDQTKRDEVFAAIRDWFTQQGALKP